MNWNRYLHVQENKQVNPAEITFSDHTLATVRDNVYPLSLPDLETPLESFLNPVLTSRNQDHKSTRSET